MYFHKFSCLDITLYGYNMKNPEKTNINWKKLEKTQKTLKKNIIWDFFNIFLKKPEKNTTHLGFFKKPHIFAHPELNKNCSSCIILILIAKLILWDFAVVVIKRHLATSMEAGHPHSRAGKNPRFIKKNQPTCFFWVLWAFLGFIVFFWVLLNFLIYCVMFHDRSLITNEKCFRNQPCHSSSTCFNKSENVETNYTLQCGLRWTWS